MRVFVTGASGFVGSAVVQELISAGHNVLGLARSNESAEIIRSLGADVQLGAMEDEPTLKAAAEASDAVIHLAFNHDFSKFAANCEADRRAIEALGDGLKDTTKPILITSGLALAAADRVATEADPPAPRTDAFPRVSELTGLDLSERGINVSIVRLPQVHDTTKQGLITYFVAIAKEKGISRYLGNGMNQFAAVHVRDCARLYRLALEKGRPGARYHAVAESGVPMKNIAEVIGKKLNVPVESISKEAAPSYFGWMAMFAGMDLTGKSDWTQNELGWKPTGPTLLEDLREVKV